MSVCMSDSGSDGMEIEYICMSATLQTCVVTLCFTCMTSFM